MATPLSTISLPLFPLQAVLFPGGLLSLKVFEPRYLDLMSACLREGQSFGVVALRRGAEVGGGTKAAPGAVSFEFTGVVAELLDVDAAQANILQVRCRGSQRFDVREASQNAEGLWEARVVVQPADKVVLPTADLIETVRGLANAITTLKQQNAEPFLKPFHFEDAGWVANRWCEILPIPLAAKQKLMALPEPLVRLQLIADFLRSKGVVK